MNSSRRFLFRRHYAARDALPLHRLQTIVAAVALAAIAFGAPATKQSARAEASDLWSRPTLTGDWGGMRSQLERNGIAFSLNYTTELFANIHGGIKCGSVVNG